MEFLRSSRLRIGNYEAKLFGKETGVRRHYIFTDKRESKKGILSAMLGAMSLISVFLTVYFTWQNHGTAYVRYGVVALLCLIFSAAGLVLGIMAKLEEDKFYLFAWIGIVLNALTLLGIGGIVAVGVYGL